MQRRAGAILIIVVVIVMMVSLAAYHFTLSMEAEHIAIRNAGDQISAQQCALSGIELVANVLDQPRLGRERLSTIIDLPIDLWPSESIQDVAYRTTIHFPLVDGVAQLLDESAKINLNVLLQWDLRTPGVAREALLRLPEMDDSTADRLLDWIDSDSDPRPQGDEQGARNSMPLLVDELAFLHNHRSDRSPANDDRQVTASPAWINHLTVHSAERNESFDGRPRIYLNTPDLVELHRQVTEALSSSIADYVVAVRQYGASEGVRPPQANVIDGDSIPIDLSVPAAFQISDLTQLMDSVVTLPPDAESAAKGVPPKQIPSPITFSGNSLSGHSLDDVFDRLTLTTETRLVGRINVLTASAAVLAAIPGLDPSLAERIVNGRESFDGGLHHPIGLLSSMAVDLTIVKEVIPHMTISGDVVRFQVAGEIHDVSPSVSHPGRSAIRCEVILDASDGPAIPVIFRQLVRPDFLIQTTTGDFDNDAQPTPDFKSRPSSNFGSS